MHKRVSSPTGRPLPGRTEGKLTCTNGKLSHVLWECKYHIVIIPKYQKKVILGRLKRELCVQRGVELIEEHVQVDHVFEYATRVQRGGYGGLPERKEC
ncbi:MAG: hypothetical protein BWY17_04326 [Deltaproteobacteria bacterium ADurb.Bin207]|jgi:hypothetical protein|nr:MAG: hypothetical protein BWY17_04326 [Deltaproteobacteria bacterium ADurb.Bin207]